ncbi:hypothetical protein HPB48_011854 [Haemaphysalis longicornis]|uniref:Uncharacterized protein n=1 Tax=Haemaphysalis longicornis TaxID=44386 RepID=A0A9J6FJC4_HAELO|nr:hypothetical protein HPB48_011854 [Haemaphysalis longicornis]
MAPSASGDDRRLDRQECAHVGGLRARAKVGGLPGSQCARAAGEPRQCGRGAARKRRRTWSARGASGRALAGARGGAPPPEAGLRLGGGGVVPSPVGAFPPRGPRGGSPMGGAWARSACGLTKADPRRFGGVKSGPMAGLKEEPLAPLRAAAWMQPAMLDQTSTGSATSRGPTRLVEFRQSSSKVPAERHIEAGGPTRICTPSIRSLAVNCSGRTKRSDALPRVRARGRERSEMQSVRGKEDGICISVMRAAGETLAHPSPLFNRRYFAEWEIRPSPNVRVKARRAAAGNRL